MVMSSATAATLACFASLNRLCVFKYCSSAPAAPTPNVRQSPAVLHEDVDILMQVPVHMPMPTVILRFLGHAGTQGNAD